MFERIVLGGKFQFSAFNSQPSAFGTWEEAVAIWKVVASTSPVWRKWWTMGCRLPVLGKVELCAWPAFGQLETPAAPKIGQPAANNSVAKGKDGRKEGGRGGSGLFLGRFLPVGAGTGVREQGTGGRDQGSEFRLGVVADGQSRHAPSIALNQQVRRRNPMRPGLRFLPRTRL